MCNPNGKCENCTCGEPVRSTTEDVYVYSDMLVQLMEEFLPLDHPILQSNSYKQLKKIFNDNSPWSGSYTPEPPY